MIDNIFVEDPEKMDFAFIQTRETIIVLSFSNDEIRKEKLSDFNARKFRKLMKDVSWNTRLKEKVSQRYHLVIQNLNLEWEI